MKSRNKTNRIFYYIVIIIVLLIWLLPFLSSINLSLKSMDAVSMRDFWSLPGFNQGYYTRMIKGLLNNSINSNVLKLNTINFPNRVFETILMDSSMTKEDILLFLKNEKLSISKIDEIYESQSKKELIKKSLYDSNTRYRILELILNNLNLSEEEWKNYIIEAELNEDEVFFIKEDVINFIESDARLLDLQNISSNLKLQGLKYDLSKAGYIAKYFIIDFFKYSSWSNYKDALMEGKIFKYFLNSIIITIPSVTIILIFSSLSGFVLSKYRFRLNRFLLAILISGMFIPPQVLAIPIFWLSQIFNTYNTYLGLILFHIGFALGFCTFYFCNFIATIPNELLAAAKIDGCSDWQIYKLIILPLIKPVFVTLAVLQFIWIWNDFFWGVILMQSQNLFPITVGLTTFQGLYVTRWNVLSAGTLIAALPPLICLLYTSEAETV